MLQLDGSEIELDIDVLTQPTLSMLYDLVMKYNPDIPEPMPEPQLPKSRPAAPKKTKNKPMSKQEQEAKIQLLKQQVAGFQGDAKPNNSRNAGQPVQCEFSRPVHIPARAYIFSSNRTGV